MQVSLEDAEALARAQGQKQDVDGFFLEHFHNDDEAKTFKNAYWPFTGIEDLEELVYTHVAALLRKQVSAGDRR